jgi:hypothetical protein
MKNLAIVFTLLFSSVLLINCVPEPNPSYPDVSRESKIPDDVIKRDSASDNHPPIMHSSEFEQPVALAQTVNTAGAEDSPFITADGQSLYFFFTPDVRILPEKQLLDSVTGVWLSKKENNVWTKAERVWLQDVGKLALDGAVCVQNNEMWFASAREGFTGVNMFTAENISGKWKNWTYCGDKLMKDFEIGEVHLHGDDLYFHSGRNGGKGNYDIWVSTRTDTSWSDPIAIDSVNTAEMDGFPYITPNGNELWFTRTYLGTPAIYRSKRVNNKWSFPELIVSQFAGEPTLDNEGNLYFVHHYFENSVMIEADIYRAKKK